MIRIFFDLESCFVYNSKVADNLNNIIKKDLEDRSKLYPYRDVTKWKNKINQTILIAKEFERYIYQIKNEVLVNSGGPSSLYPNNELNFWNVELINKMFIKDGKGANIENKILETRSKLLDLVDNQQFAKEISATLPLSINLNDKNSNYKNWHENTFKNLPVAAILSILEKIISDSKLTTNILVNYFIDYSYPFCDLFEPYFLGILPNKNYFITGKDRFNANIAFLRSNSILKNNVEVKINGQIVESKDGYYHYSSKVEREIGEKSVTATATITHPITGKKSFAKNKFYYYVGHQPPINVIPDNMNIFYIGVDNPITINFGNRSLKSVLVSISGVDGSVKGNGNNYIVNVNQPGICNLIVNSDELEIPSIFRFVSKPIPDPIPILGVKGKTQFDMEDFKNQKCLRALIENFDFDVSCEISSFNIQRIGMREDPVNVINQGEQFSEETLKLIQLAKPGDTYMFMDIKSKCKCDTTIRYIGSLIANIQ